MRLAQSAPLFGLTLRAMFVGMRHRQGPSPGLSLFASMSVVALLALACFPVLAQAEDSSGVQYSDDIPRADGNNSPTPEKKPPIAKAADGGGATAPAGATGADDAKGGSSEDDSSSKGGGAVGKGNDGGTGQGSRAGSANGARDGNLQPSAQAKGAPVSQESDGGSSPLVPILIAILVLAAISLAVVMIRQRRQGRPTTPISQKAS